MTEFFKLIELYMGDGLEMAGHSAIVLEKFYTVTVYLCHGLGIMILCVAWENSAPQGKP